MRRVLRMDGGDGCTTMWKCLTPLNCTPKNGQFYVVCFLPQLEERSWDVYRSRKRPCGLG